MPRGFLIKRKKHMSSTWPRRGSEGSEQTVSESGSERADTASPPEPSQDVTPVCNSPVNLTTSNSDVFSKGLDLTMKSASTEESSEKSDTPVSKSPATENEELDNNNVKEMTSVEDLHLKAQKMDQILDNAKHLLQYREYNNNRNPLAAFNRENYHNYLPSSLPSSAPLSISTSSWSPFYLAAFDHLNVNSSPSSQSQVSSPRSTLSIPVPPPPSVSATSPQTQVVPATNAKKRAHPSPAGPKPPKSCKKTKAQRKIEFNEDKSSPVSGTYIREEGDDGIRVVSGDIDSNLNLVEITPEAEAELAKIENKIGDFRCQLCKDLFENAFGLAQHRCSRIVHVEYRCPECDKVFNCPANLASHRRWHKPRGQQISSKNSQKATSNSQASVSEGGTTRITASPNDTKEESQFSCKECGKLFKRQAYLRKHMATHSNATDKPFPCHLCGKVLHNEAERAKHIVQHSMPPIPKDFFKQHPMQSLKDIMCRLCGTTCTDRLSFEQHMRLHGPESYQCKLCPISFYSAPELNRHITKCHPTHGRPPVVMIPIPPLNRPC